MNKVLSQILIFLVFMSLFVSVGSAQWTKETELNQASQQIEAVTFSKNGDYLAYAAGSNVYVHDIATWTHLQTISLSENVQKRGIDFGPDDGLLAIEGSNNIYVYETTLWTEETSISNDGTGGVDFSPDGNYLGSAMGDNDLFRIYETDFWTVETSKSDENWAEQGTSFSHDSNFLAIGKGRGNVEIYDVETGDQVDSLGAADVGSDWRAYDVDITQNFAIHGNDDSNCYIYDSTTWEHERTLTAPSGATGRNVDISGDESWAGCIDNANERIYVWSIEDNWNLNETFSNSVRFRFSNDGQYIAYEQGSSLVVEIFDAANPPLAPSDPSPEDRGIVRSDSTEISAQYNNDGGVSGSITFYENDGTEIGTCGPINDGERCGVNWGTYSHGENEWYAQAETVEGTVGAESEQWTLIKNQPPVVDQLVKPDLVTVNGNSTLLKADVSDDNSGDSLTVEFYDNKTNTLLGTDTVIGSGTAEVQWQPAGQEDGQIRGENNWWRVRVKDTWELNWSKENASFYVNALPSIIKTDPEDEGVSTNSPTLLNVTATDKESSEIDIFFYNADNRNLVGHDSISSGDTAGTTWSGLSIGDQHDWFLNISDGRENFTSTDLTFNKLTSPDFRPSVRIEQTYSSIITSRTESAHLLFEVENSIEQDKDSLNTSLHGVNANFLNSNQAWKTYTLEGGSTRRFEVLIEPKSAGEKTLSITTKNQDLNISTTEQIPVHVKNRSRITTEEEVPGVGFLHLIVIMLAAGALYWTSL